MFECEDTNTGIYCILNKESNKRYIGQAINLHNRCVDHRSDLYNQTHFNDYLQKSFNLHGEEAFEFLVLEHCHIEELDERECYYMSLYNVEDRDYGYNLKSGGQHGGSKLCKESRKKLSDSIKASYTDELRQKRSDFQKAQWDNPEIRVNRIGENAPMYGHHHTDEVKKRLSEFRKGKSFNLRNPDKVLCVETGRIYDNSRVAHNETGIDSSSILKTCRGERKIAGGYHWQFVIEESNWENKVS